MSTLDSLLLNSQPSNPTLIQKSIIDFFQTNNVSWEPLINHLISSEIPSAPLDQYNLMFDLFTLLILNELSDDKFSCNNLEQLREYNTEVIKSCPWLEFQPLEALYQINRFLLRQKINSPSIQQFPTGAAPIESSSSSLHHSGVFFPLHLELGFLWGIFGYLTEQPSFCEASKKLASWQAHLLNHLLEPSSGVFTKEKDHDQNKLSLSHYMLFRLVAMLFKEGSYESLATFQLRSLQNSKLTTCSSLAKYALLNTWVRKNLDYVSPQPAKKESILLDPYNSLACFKQNQASFFSILNGTQTGLGHVHFGKTAFVNFGPQSYPLDECDYFGILQSSPVGSNPSCEINTDTNCETFSLSQKLRLATFKSNEPCNAWMEITQQLKDKTLKISASLQTTQPSNSIAFSFFAKAESCLIEGEGALEPNTLSQFEWNSKMCLPS